VAKNRQKKENPQSAPYDAEAAEETGAANERRSAGAAKQKNK